MAVRWYIVHTYSGFENKIAAFVKEQAEKKGLSHLLEDVLVPTESVVSVRNGAKVSSERKFFPGYVLVKMEMTPETWHLVSSTPKVTGFLGGKKPIPMTLPPIVMLVKLWQSLNAQKSIEVTLLPILTFVKLSQSENIYTNNGDRYAVDFGGDSHLGS